MNPKRKLILSKSAQLFLEKGYAGSSIREIAQKVGLEPSSIYSHVNSKRDILANICFGHAQNYLQGIERILETYNHPKEQLETLLDMHLDIAMNDQSSAIVFGEEWKNLSAEQLKLFLKLRKEYENKIIEIIKSGKNLGEFKELDENYVMQTLLSAIRWVHYWYKPASRVSKKHLKKSVISMLLSGLYT